MAKGVHLLGGLCERARRRGRRPQVRETRSCTTFLCDARVMKRKERIRV